MEEVQKHCSRNTVVATSNAALGSQHESVYARVEVWPFLRGISMMNTRDSNFVTNTVSECADAMIRWLAHDDTDGPSWSGRCVPLSSILAVDVNVDNVVSFVSTFCNEVKYVHQTQR